MNLRSVRQLYSGTAVTRESNILQKSNKHLKRMPLGTLRLEDSVELRTSSVMKIDDTNSRSQFEFFISQTQLESPLGINDR